MKIPADYKVNGVWLNKWLNEQKHIILGKRKGKSLTSEQVKKLDSIGFIVKQRMPRIDNSSDGAAVGAVN